MSVPRTTSSTAPADAPRPSLPARAPFSRPTTLLSLALLLASLAAFWNVPRCDFVNLDDSYYVTENLRVQHGLSLANLYWAFTDFNAYWIPITWLSLMLDGQIARLLGDQAGGPSPVPFHVSNLLLHMANAVVLFLTLRRATGSPWRSALAAALFSLHPLRVESVAWVTERKDVLSGLFALFAIWLYVGAGRRDRGQLAGPTSSAASLDLHRPSSARLLGVAMLMVLSFWSKPMLITLPCVLLLLDAWPLGRRGLPRWGASRGATTAPSSTSAAAPPHGDGPIAPPSGLRPWLEKLPLLLLAAAFAFITVVTQTHTGAVRTGDVYGPATRLSNAVVSYARYLGKHFWFGNLAVPYPYPPAWPPLVVAAAAGLFLFITIAALRLYRSRPFVAVGWLWFVGTLVPVIGVIQSGDQSMADRFTYFPSIGLCVALAWALPESSVATAARRWLTGALVGALLLTMSIFTFRQVDHWRDSVALFTHATRVTQGNFAAHDILGRALAAKGDPLGAVREFRRSVEINPYYYDGRFNLGAALLRQCDFRAAAEHLDVAAQIRPASPQAHSNLGFALANLGKVDAAIRHYELALAHDASGNARIVANLANALLLKGDAPRAVEQYRRALALGPDSADLRLRLAAGLASMGRFDDALAELARAETMRPGDPAVQQLVARIHAARQPPRSP